MNGDCRRVVNSAAPIRICDNGGWTDTWFARYGKIFNVAVSPYVEVQIEAYARDSRPERVTIYAENYGERYAMGYGRPGWDRHPLIEATVKRMGLPEDLAIEISIYCQAPGGASTGTSAAVCVTLIGALDRLRGGSLAAQEVAYLAHAVETEDLGQQCGIQDQLCSALGGVNLIDMYDYPRAKVSGLNLSDALWWELERRLVLVYSGRSHSSSEIHERVIRGLEDAGPDNALLDALRATAEPSHDALLAGDFSALGRAMIANTEAQRRLHPDLIGRDAQRIIDVARDHGALGWKVNGAGGEGGSVSLLCAGRYHARRAMIREIEQEDARFRHIPTTLSRLGLHTWEQVPGGTAATPSRGGADDLAAS
jgi:D-glycero-alpha-D-manno-heptose-7-phosphate kinase